MNIHSYIDASGNQVSAHPFIVMDSSVGTIDGKRYNLTAIACSSYKSTDDKFTLGLRNRSIVNVYASDGMLKDSFAKCGCLVYFNLAYYQYIGSISDRAWNDIIRKIDDLYEEGKLTKNTNNL